MSGKKRGRKPWEPTPERLETITRLYGKGVPERTIAGAVGLSPSEFSRKKTQLPQLTQALNKGLEFKADRIVEATDMLWDRILEGSNGLLCFWLKCQADWSEDGAEKAAREVYARLEKQREQVEREIGTKLRADADRQFSTMLESFFDRCAKELAEDEYDRIVDLFPTAIDWRTANREASEEQDPPEEPESEQT